MSTELKKRNVPFSPPDMTEAEANEVRDAILSGWITTGPRTKKLESLIADYVGVAKCVCLNSQTACGEMALRILGIGEGDEVIVPAYTYTASASVVAHVGATVRMVDVLGPRSTGSGQAGSPTANPLEMDYDQLAEAINEKTKAIIPVDLGGIPCDYDRIYEIVKAKAPLFQPKNDIQRKLGRVAVCCDAAHAFGASRLVSKVPSCSNVPSPETFGTSGTLEPRKAMVGVIADFSNFSFHAVKNFTTAEGGAMTWNLPFGEEKVERQQMYYGSPLPVIEGETWNGFIYRLSQLFSLHGQNKDALAKTKLGAWEYDIIGPWYKCNMTDVAAAMGLIQFARYPELLAKRKQYIAKFDAAFKDLPVALMKHYTDEYESSGHLYLVRLLGRTREDANKVIEQMAERGIACNVHYKPLPMMTAYKAMGFDIKDYPNAYNMFVNEVTLPLNTKMTEEDVEYVIENFVEIVKGL